MSKLNEQYHDSNERLREVIAVLNEHIDLLADVVKRVSALEAGVKKSELPVLKPGATKK